MRTLEQAWNHLLTVLLQIEPTVSRVGPAREALGVLIRVEDPRSCMISNSRRKMSPKYAAGELIWYLAQSNDLAFIKHYAPSYDRFSDDGVSLHGAYGPRLGDFMPRVVKRLSEGDRRIVVPIYRRGDFEYTGKDCPCTLSIQFLQRDGLLHMFVNMRSNDAWIGFIYDAWVWMMVMQIVAGYAGLGLGVYHHYAASMHLYERNVEAAQEAVSEEFIHRRPTYVPFVFPQGLTSNDLRYHVHVAVKNEEVIRSGQGEVTQPWSDDSIWQYIMLSLCSS